MDRDGRRGRENRPTVKKIILAVLQLLLLLFMLFKVPFIGTSFSEHHDYFFRIHTTSQITVQLVDKEMPYLELFAVI